jgi:hypothetical protein
MDRLSRSPLVAVFAAGAALLAMQGAGALHAEAWPPTRDGLVFLWETRLRPGTIAGADSKTVRICRVTPRGRAVFGRFFEMDCAGGDFLADDLDAAALESPRRTAQLSVEALITPADGQARGTGRILTFAGTAEEPDFALTQEGDRLVLRMRTSAARDAGRAVDMGKVAGGRAVHVLASCGSGRLTCYLGGAAAGPAAGTGGGLPAWAPQRLVFGGDWAGRIEGVAIYNRALSSEEAARHFAAATGRLTDRRPAERLVVEARLAEPAATPDPKTIAPYVRALVVGTFDVEKVLEGRCDGRRIQVARWAILDRTALAPARQVGRPYRLVLERFEDHPELESERLVTDSVKADVALYYDPER